MNSMSSSQLDGVPVQSTKAVALSIGRLSTAEQASLGSAHTKMPLMIIDPRARDRECLAQCLIAHQLGLEVKALPSIEDWWHQSEAVQPAAILLNVGGKKTTDPAIGEEIRKLVADFSTTPIIVLSDTDELHQIVKSLEYGARGYIPSSVGVDICIGAIRLAIAGGVFVPASSVLAMGKLPISRNQGLPMGGMFTHRQCQVVEALLRGKANKIIAYELQLRESTVKVHIRSIMKKVHATNRTEVAYKINDMFPN